jgi:restriction system protein
MEGVNYSVKARAGAGVWDQEITLDKWMDFLRAGIRSPDFIDYHLLSKEQYDEFVERISSFSEEDIILVLGRLLIRSGTLGNDVYSAQNLEYFRENDPSRYSRMMRHSFYRRLARFSARTSKEPPWEGITWVTDLLPHSPREAIAALEAYYLTHAGLLPDGRLVGLSDALGIIRARYIGIAGTQPERLELLRQLDPRDFEHLINQLYRALDYETTLTPQVVDGGRDIIAKRTTPGKAETLLVECKRYSAAVGIAVVRSLLGVVSDERVNRGVLVTSGRFTRSARVLSARNPRIELIAGEDLVPLLNEHLGTNWVAKIDGLILASKRQANKGREKGIT